MNHGTNVGDIAEVEFVSVFNSNKTNFKSYLKHFDKYKNPWMIRVTTKQISSLSFLLRYILTYFYDLDIILRFIIKVHI